MHLRTATPRVPGSRSVRRLRSLGVRILAAAAAVPLVAFPLSVGSPSQVTASAATATSEATAVTLSFAPENGGLSQPGQPLVVSGSLTNTASSALPAGTLTVRVVQQVANESALRQAWSDPDAVQGVTLTTIPTPALLGSGAVQLSAVVPADVLDGALAGTGWGAHALVVDFVGDDVTASNGSAVVRLDGAPPISLTVASILPITVAPSTEGLLTSEELALATAPGGLLTQRLASVVDPRVTLALDPRIVASIRVLGTSAPATATAWLSELEALPNAVVALQYADADPALQLNAGATAPLQPESFVAALDAADFATVTPSPTPSTTDTPAPTPSATATETAGTPSAQVPSTEQILAYPYTRTDVAWPAGGTSTDQTIDASAAAGLTTTIVSAEQLSATTGAVADADGRRVLVADSLSSDVSDSVFAVGTTDSRVDTSRATGLLAAATLRSTAGTPILLALDRGRTQISTSTDRLGSLLTLPWIEQTDITGAQSATSVAASLLPASDDRIPTTETLFSDQGDIAAFSSVLSDPQLVISTARLDLLATLSAGWSENSIEWPAAVSTMRSKTGAVLTSVSVDDSSQINLLAYATPMPVNISNRLPYPVTVQVVPRASNGRLFVSGKTVTIDPESTGRVQLDAKAVANGRVSVSISLASPTYVAIGTPKTLQLEVQPFVETAGIAVLAALVAALLGFGIFRSIRRRRRTGGAESADEAGSATASREGRAV